MQIKQVELLVGMTQKNIRFYEKEGLLNPRREAGNGYRNYTEEDVRRLQRIKLLRKLDVPVGEIAVMLEGRLTLAQGMSRHKVVLENRRKNIDTAQTICEELAQRTGLLSDLDAEQELMKMEQLEEKGVRFVNVQKQDKKKRYRGAGIVASVLVALMLLLELWIGWMCRVEPLPLGAELILRAVPIVIAAGILLALWQRIQEIKGGELDDYCNY